MLISELIRPVEQRHLSIYIAWLHCLQPVTNVLLYLRSCQLGCPDNTELGIQNRFDFEAGDEALEATDLLASAARRYNVSLTAKKSVKSKAAKCPTKAGSTATETRKTKAAHAAKKSVKKTAAQKGGAA